MVNNRQGAKKLYKTHRGWVAAGLAAAMLVVPALIGSQTVSAADGDLPVAQVADATTAQTDLNAAVQGIVDAVNGADLSTEAGFAAAQAAVGQHSAAMQTAVTAGAEMSAVPADLVAQMQAALGKLADAQKQSVLQGRLNTAVQTIIDAVNNNDLSTTDGYNAASAVAQQQSVAMQEAVDAGAKTEDIPANLQTALQEALGKLAAIQKQSVLQERLNTAVQTIIDAVNNNDLSTTAGYNAASAVAEQQNTAMEEAVNAGAKIEDLPANMQTALKEALAKLSAIQKPMIAQEHMNAAVQTMIDAVNNADLTTSEGYKAASDTVSQQEQAMTDAQAAGATTDAIPSNLYASLESALAKLRAAQPKASVTVHYRDATGKDLKPATTLKDIGLPGGTVDMSEQDLDTDVAGYQLQSVLHPVVLQETGTDVYLEYIAEPQSVTMHFQDAVSGKELKSPTTLPNVGVTGESVDLSAQTLDTAIDGYRLQSTLNPAYTLKASGNDITLLYLAQPQSLNIHYADAITGKELKAPTTLSNVGLTGETVDLSAQAIDTAISGYALQSTLNPAYTLKASGNDITLLYLAQPQSVTIHYQDATTGKELKPATTLSNVGLTDETVDLTTQGINATIDGYDLQNTLSNAYTLKAGANDITLLYDAQTQSVTVRYQDAKGNDLKPATILSNIGVTGATVDLTKQGLDTAIAGYDLQNELSTAYTLKASANDVTLLYAALPQTITIHYQDAKTGNELKDATILPNIGVTGDSVDLTTQNLDTTIAGYGLQSLLNDAYTLKADNNDITLLYLAQPQSLMIHYQSATTGAELKDATTLTNVGLTGETIDLTMQDIDTSVDGYTLQNALNTAYTLQAEGNEITLLYVGQPQKLIVHFVVAGSEMPLIADQIFEQFGATGDVVDLTTLGIDSVDGFTMKTLLPTDFMVVAGVNEITLEFVEDIQPTPTPTPTPTPGKKPITTIATATTPPTDQQPQHHDRNHGDHNTETNTQATLPQNGDHTNAAATVAGLGIIGALLTLMGIDLKKRHV